MERAVVKGRWKLIASSRGRRELYDMVSDPTESTNLAAGRADVARAAGGPSAGLDDVRRTSTASPYAEVEARKPPSAAPEGAGIPQVRRARFSTHGHDTSAC